MAIDIRKGSHMSTFPSKILSMMGNGGHVYNLVMGADSDNGSLAGRGSYVSFDQYDQAAAPNGFAGVVLEQAASGRWYVEVTAVPASAELLYVYNAPVSEYAEKDFQDESLFYNKAGEVAQGATLHIGDVFEISENGFNQTPTAGDTVTYVGGVYTI